ncbi:MAG: hypothetical protein LW859_42080 [Anabaena sp. 49633_E8]|nr:hypothetical protein [Anabaena sp. 49633_E8]
MTTLFDLAQYVTPTKREIDPHWDEVVLDCSGRVDDNGQVTLFYDASDEPPDPDDFQDHIDFEVAWSDWEKQHPDFKPAMPPFPEQTDEDFMDVLEECQESVLATCKTFTRPSIVAVSAIGISGIAITGLGRFTIFIYRVGILIVRSLWRE